MKFLMFYIKNVVFFTIFYWIIKKAGIYNKLFGKQRNKKYHKVILILIIVLLWFPLDFMKYLLNEKYGFPNYISIIIDAFLCAICIHLGKSYLKEKICNICE